MCHCAQQNLAHSSDTGNSLLDFVAANHSVSHFVAMRPLTDEETVTFFKKLTKLCDLRLCRRCLITAHV